MMGLSLVLASPGVPVSKTQANSADPVSTGEKSTADGGQWKFTAGKRARRSAKGAASAPLPSKSLHRPPIAPAGGYQGLRLDSKTQPPVEVIPDAKGAPVLTWVGFQRDRSNQGVVFVQVDREVEVKLSSKRGRFELFLPGVKVTQANHARSLDLRYFPQSSARKVKTKVGKKGTKITVYSRNRVAPQMSTRPGPEGQFQILLAFPPAQ